MAQVKLYLIAEYMERLYSGTAVGTFGFDCDCWTYQTSVIEQLIAMRKGWKGHQGHVCRASWLFENVIDRFHSQSHSPFIAGSRWSGHSISKPRFWWKENRYFNNDLKSHRARAKCLFPTTIKAMEIERRRACLIAKSNPLSLRGGKSPVSKSCGRHIPQSPPSISWSCYRDMEVTAASRVGQPEPIPYLQSYRCPHCFRHPYLSSSLLFSSSVLSLHPRAAFSQARMYITTSLKIREGPIPTLMEGCYSLLFDFSQWLHAMSVLSRRFRLNVARPTLICCSGNSARK